jgi:hypothetical protein
MSGFEMEKFNKINLNFLKCQFQARKLNISELAPYPGREPKQYSESLQKSNIDLSQGYYDGPMS